MKLLDIIFEAVVEGKQLYTDDDIEKEAKIYLKNIALNSTL